MAKFLIKEVKSAKEIHLKRLQRLLSMRFQILDSTLRLQQALRNFDHERIAEVYQKLADSLQRGARLENLA